MICSEVLSSTILLFLFNGIYHLLINNSLHSKCVTAERGLSLLGSGDATIPNSSTVPQGISCCHKDTAHAEHANSLSHELKHWQMTNQHLIFIKQTLPLPAFKVIF